MEERKRLWCRNCNEVTTHELIRMEKIPTKGKLPLLRRSDMIPVYACFFCRCERGDENGTAFGKGFERRYGGGKELS